MLKWRRIYWHTQCKNWCLQVRKCWKWKIGNKCHAQMMLCCSNCVCRSTELRMQTEMHSRYVFANQLGIIFERKNSACILLAWWMGCHQPLDKKISWFVWSLLEHFRVSVSAQKMVYYSVWSGIWLKIKKILIGQ